MAKTFLFDLAGVLIDWEVMPLYREIFAEDESAVTRFFDTVLTTQRLNEISMGRKAHEVIEELKHSHPNYGRALDAWIDDWDRMVTGPIEGTVEIARELRRLGYHTYLLGNWGREEFERARNRFPLLDEFHGVVISGDHGVMKPSAQIFEIAVMTFGLTPTETVFIDDSPRNEQAAALLGFDAIEFTNVKALRNVLIQRGFLSDSSSQPAGDS